MDVENGPDRLSLTLTLPAPPDRVWEILTGPEHIRSWWGDHVTLDARVGGKLREDWDDGTGIPMVTEGEVLTCQPPNQLVMTWKDRGWPLITRVSITLEEPAPGRTRLRLDHTGWDALGRGQGEEAKDTLLANHSAGWSIHLRDMRDHLRAM
ncbi:MAG: SRPBCC domain-containing protein [Rhodospirillum sp.]|nr:SRPBCC domain-containing protein [Rhodospirillum sp.]MCF8490281.1 SRPBCC domain-containing protein [Rhodospirillum sp.]MCF8499348.1 SRPBCC domain-containing protein [Rhodospirillum sp.]